MKKKMLTEMLEYARSDLESLELSVKHGARWADKCWGIVDAKKTIAECEKALALHFSE